ncbi:tetratricopeptide repeat protein [Azospirillum oryzae]|uniref:Tetratricopeptide repeat protein n=1 Tax=Azospirillum oryzae TaxID=286727 RepID=A0A6N1AR49_9PROT|nr:heme biosynthesis HemY N-terminal domain-containing protein [Azospirillum oryzae]KAA0590613.1 tetratricopeptide repeat protein [Azospirillum oryzae]QKS52977.1 tetratricopeptide repeat protein [Azospirillum oryzae]GLR80075.1 heme biosynthesis protein HemY [Azospirillum oryzae]
MIRALWFLLKVAVVIAAAIWLADRPGTVSVHWLGYAVEAPFWVALLVTIVALGIAALGYRLIRGLIRTPYRIRRHSRVRRRERGYRALTQGMVAIAAGDAQTARKMARKADGLLNEPPLTMLLSAQAAQLQGDERAAREYFTAMLERPETAFLGMRGLLTQAIKSGDRVEALTLARKARGLQPNTPWLLGTLYDLEAQAGDWAAAEGTLQQAIQAGAIPTDEGRRHRAVLLLERSFEAERRGRADAALSHAQAAHDMMPGFVPAAVRLARLQLAADRLKPAAKVVERAWRQSPHPELADIYRTIVSSYDALTRVRLFQKLVRQAPDSTESHLAVARAAIDAQLWGEARQHLNRAMEIGPTRRTYRLMAELDRGERHDEDAAKDWLAKAANAPEDPVWTCSSCGAVSHNWGGLCGHCGAFDTLTWKAPTVAVPVMEPTDLPPALARPATA